jgi:hypothetical protein
MYLADILMPLPTETPGLPGSVPTLASPNSPLPEGRDRRRAVPFARSARKRHV